MPSAVRWLVALAVASLVWIGAPPRAHAYVWMIRHGYTGCAPCHTDPSGGMGALTAYGRAQSDLLLRTRYSGKTEEADKTAGLLWGAVELPESLRLGGDVRESWLHVKQEGAPSTSRWILMRSDLYGDVKVGRLRAAGALGFSHEGALGASLTRAPTDNLVSREHWVGVELDEDGAWLARAGRIALPFGLRNIEHTFWVRALTRTDLDDNQQHGVALSWSKEPFRAELMGIVGNLQLRPDDFRERGYSAYAEYSPAERLAFGVSSLFTRARRDINLRVTDYRQAHGLFARYAPIPALVLLGEADFLYQSLTWNGHREGFATLVQADLEPLQGLHVILSEEQKNSGASSERTSYGFWTSFVWFFAPHADLRLDGNYQRLIYDQSNTGATTLLAQLHVFL